MQSYEPFVMTVQTPTCAQVERHAAFAKLVAQFRGMAFAYAMQLLGNEQQAQDVTQEAFLTAYQRLAQLRDPAAFPGWLRRIVHSQCHRSIRVKSPESVPLDYIDETSFMHEALCADGDLAQRLADEDAAQALIDCVMAAVADLPAHERSVVRLFYFDEYSIRDVARALNLPVTTIKKRLQYARSRLRTRLQENFRQGGMSMQTWTMQSLAAQVGQWLFPLLAVSVAQPLLCPVCISTPRWIR